MATAYIGIGSNVGNRRENIRRAISMLPKERVHVVRASGIIETDPVGGVAQEKFLNAVIKVTTELLPTDLLASLKSIEHRMGRAPTVRNGPRIIDLDILIYDGVRLSTTKLTIPHPRMHQRDFVLGPLKEIAPELFKGKRLCEPSNPCHQHTNISPA